MHRSFRERDGRLAIIAIAGLFAAGPARAGEPALVVADVTDAEAVERSTDRVQLLTGVVIPKERAFGLDDLVASVGYSSLTEGAVEVFACRGPAVDGDTFAARLGDAVQRVDELDLPGAMAGLAALAADLPCSVAPIPARQLHDLFFFDGLMAAYGKDRDRAVKQFARAAALKADVPWNESYDPAAQQIFLLGKEQALTAPMLTLTVVPPVDARRIWLDGKQLEGGGSFEAELRPGTHVVHIETAAGALRAVGLDLAGGDALWSDPRAAAAAAEGGVLEGPPVRAANVLLARAGDAWQTDVVYVGSSRGVFVWRRGVGLMRAERPKTPIGDGFSLRVGANALVRAPRYGGRPLAYAAPQVSIEAGLLRGLELAVDFGVGIARFAEGTTSVLPHGAAGFQWAWPGISARPYAGVQAAMAVTGPLPEDLRGGGLLRLGVRFVPARDGALRLQLGAAFGWVGGVQAQLGLSVGFGARPKARG
jgi:hypothetical protein